MTEEITVVADTPTTLTPPSYEEIIRPELSRARGIRDLAASIKIADHLAYAEAGEIIKGLRADAKAIEEGRKRFTKPALDWVAAIRDWYRPIEEAYEAAIESLKEKTAAYDRMIKESQRVAMVASLPAPPPPRAEGLSHSVRRKVRVVTAALVPREFCSPDEAKIAAHFKSTGEAPPGCEIYEETITTSRGSRGAK